MPRSFAALAKGASRLMGDDGICIALSDKLGMFFNFISCKDSASREQYKKSWLFFIAEALPILFKDSASRLWFLESALFLLPNYRASESRGHFLLYAERLR
jgi:hypothetical protein